MACSPLTGFNSLATAVHGGDLMMVRGLTSLVFVITAGCTIFHSSKYYSLLYTQCFTIQ